MSKWNQKVMMMMMMATMITIICKGTSARTANSKHFRSPCKCRKVLTILSLRADVPDEVFTQLSGIHKYLVTTATRPLKKTKLL